MYNEKRFWIPSLVATGLLLAGCIHTSTSNQAIDGRVAFQNDVTSAGRKISRAPAEFLLGEQLEDINPADQMFFDTEKEKIDCTKVLTRTETFQGKIYNRFSISKVEFLACPQVKAMKTSRVWKVKKTTWSSQDELAFENFIRQMAVSKCNTMDNCLSGPGNILRTEEDMLNNFYSDCADFPYYLRAYFAYKMNLPMSFVLEIAQNPFTPEQIKQIEAERAAVLLKDGDEGLVKYDKQVGDLRYSRNGNIPVSRLNIPSTIERVRDFGVIGPNIVDIISSGFMRMAQAPEFGKIQPDFYSPKIIAQNIRAGTVLYNVAGHVAVVYEVTPKGEVLFMDAHPDNSISRGSFNLDYQPLRSTYGGNFKNFRPISVLNPKYNAEGVIVSGQIRVATDAEIPQFSLEQYNGDSAQINGKKTFKLKSTDTKGADFHDWVKYRLSGGTYRLDPKLEMKNEVDSLCLSAQDRVIAVQEAVNNGVHNLPHPPTLPQNIYGAEGEWESYSSPGRDLRLRTKILSIPAAAKEWIARYNAKDPLITYSGTNIKQDLMNAYQAAANSCKISYTNSNGAVISVTLERIINRVALLSYDPYMCPELRWGANTQTEISTCKDNSEKLEWHQLQQFFRNTLEKDTTGVHGYSLSQLRQMNATKQVNNANTSNQYNILTKLQAL
jgi:hypothetical protein